MTDLWQLWHIAHDRTEIPAGELLEELAALGYKPTQQTLSNYVARGWVDRKRVDVAPGGVGQTGYFERASLVPVVLAARTGGRRPILFDSARKESKRQRISYPVACLQLMALLWLTDELDPLHQQHKALEKAPSVIGSRVLALKLKAAGIEFYGRTLVELDLDAIEGKRHRVLRKTLAPLLALDDDTQVGSVEEEIATLREASTAVTSWLSEKPPVRPTASDGRVEVAAMSGARS